MTQLNDDLETSNSLCIEGKATVTAETSTTTKKVTNKVTPRASHACRVMAVSGAEVVSIGRSLFLGVGTDRICVDGNWTVSV